MAASFGMNENGNRPSPESLLAKLKEGEQAKLRVYIGAAPGVGKTYQMLADAHLLKKQGADIVVAAEAAMQKRGIEAGDERGGDRPRQSTETHAEEKCRDHSQRADNDRDEERS